MTEPDASPVDRPRSTRRPAPRDAWPSGPGGPTTTRRPGADPVGHHAPSCTPTVEEGRAHGHHGRADRFYSRYGNPTVAAFEDAIAELEGAESGRAFASGMGAISAVVLGLCSKGDHIVAQRQLYAGTQLLLQTACPRFGIDVTFVDGTEPGALRRRPCGRARRCSCSPRRRPTRASTLVDLDELGAIAGSDHRGRLHLRHPARPAAARPRRRPRRALGHQGHRRPQRRHARRGRRQRRAGRLAVELRRAAGRQRLAVRRHERAAGPAHARRCASRQSETAQQLAECLEAHPGRGRRVLPGPRRRIRSASWPSGRWPTAAALLTIDLAGGLRGRAGLRRGACAWPSWPPRSAVPRRW